ncbi:glycosyltransferase, partial [Streptomyces sp. NPDC057674]|uniref:glycosyltransferase n=1 Tax=Streptomyces sp. NPDC057674 TaxID=3346203 RepID=UPI0036A9EA79
AMPALLRRLPELRVDLCGDGPEGESLRKLAAGLGIGSAVEFHGHVSDERKQELFHRAWLTVVPSVAEGWGLAVIEANTVGTPALAFDVPGLRDAIRPGVNGWLLDRDADLSAGIASALDALSTPEARDRAADRCRAWAAAFSWDASAERLAQVVVEDLQRIRRHRRSRRSTSDLSVITRFTSPDPESTERAVRRALRQTDAWQRKGDAFRLLLHGCDEMRALSALRRLDVAEADIALANGHDVLLGAAEPGEGSASGPAPGRPS